MTALSSPQVLPGPGPGEVLRSLMASPLHYYMAVVVLLGPPFGMGNVTSIRQYRSLGGCCHRLSLEQVLILPSRSPDLWLRYVCYDLFSLRQIPASSVGLSPCFCPHLYLSSTYCALCSDWETKRLVSPLSQVPHRSWVASRPQTPLPRLHGRLCMSHSHQAPSSPFMRWISLPPRRHWYHGRTGHSCGGPGPALWPAFFPGSTLQRFSPYRRSLALLGSW